MIVWEINGSTDVLCPPDFEDEDEGETESPC